MHILKVTFFLAENFMYKICTKYEKMIFIIQIEKSVLQSCKNMKILYICSLP